jgi:hypothetical protein
MIQLLSDAWRNWRRFWFDEEDPLAVCVMRWPMVGMILYTHFIWTFDFEAFFSDHASWQSRDFIQQYQSQQFAYSFWWYVPSDWAWAAHFLSLAIITFFWVGFLTPITGWLCFAIVVSYANRVPLAMYGLDQVNGIAALYLALSPCGARLSVDSWIRRRLQGKQSVDDHAAPSASARLAIRLFQVHLCFIYLWGGLGKLQGQTWWNGEAIWLAAASSDYQSNDLTWIVYFPWLYQTLSVGTWVWEISFPILVWHSKLRPWVLMIGVSMHLGIGMFMGMWTFGLAMLFLYLAFIPANGYRTFAAVAKQFLINFLHRVEPDESPIEVSSGGPEVLAESRGV